ncbi:hypothetical protein [Labrys neptuniae]
MLTDDDLRNIRTKAEMDSKSMGHQATFQPGTVLDLLLAIDQARTDGFRSGQSSMRRRAIDLCNNSAGLTDDQYRRRSQAWNDGVLDVAAALRSLPIQEEESLS